jgi:hypothetical protein
MESRRRFLIRATGGAVVLLSGGDIANALTLAGVEAGAAEHPEPRPGIDASRVLPASEVPERLKELFDQIRAIPEIVDGIRCHCGCAEIPDMYSLLSCYEGTAMAQFCDICQGEGRLVTRLRSEGRTLAEIRKAVDEKFA